MNQQSDVVRGTTESSGTFWPTELSGVQAKRARGFKKGKKIGVLETQKIESWGKKGREGDK